MVTVNKAIRKGHLTVTLPVVAFQFVAAGIIIYLDKLKLYSNASLAIPAIVTMTTPWLYWSFMITKWRLWAFENVDIDDVWELKYKAIKQGLIWRDGSIFGKTEIRTKAQKKKWKEIQSKIDAYENSL